MAVVEMKKLSVCALKRHRKEILEALQSMGAMEIRINDIDDEDLQKMETDSSRKQFEKTADAFDKALKAISELVPDKDKQTMFDGLKTVSRAEYNNVIENRDSLVKDSHQVLKLQKERTEAEARIQKNQAQIESFVPWMKLGIPMNTTETKETAVFIGSVPGSVDEATITAGVIKDIPEPIPVTVELISSGNEATCITVMCVKRLKEQVESNLRNIGFSRPAVLISETPEEETNRLKAEIEKETQTISTVNKKIESFASERKNFKIACDYYRTRAEKYRVLGTLPQTEHAFFLEGWVTKASAPKIEKFLTEKFDALVETEEKGPDEEEPTVLKNNSFSQNVEGVLASYGLPQHGKIDPTFLMSFFYVVFFGMMLSDAGYGVVITIACFVILKKHKTIEDGLKKMLSLFFWCGISTIFWGFMYGGFFGNAIDTIAKTFFGYTGGTILKPLWFEPVANPMKLLIWCMLFGIIHLYCGLGIKGAQLIKDHDIVSFISDVVSWYLLVTGLIFILLPSELFHGISGMTFNFPAAVAPIAKYSAIIGALIILVMSGRANKNFAIRIALGAYDIYGITGWLSDVLSYSRLLALGLATGVIANVINMMASMVGGGVVGAIIFIIVFILGHTLNIGINALGAYVHTNRLQYVEFFGKFYDGGGISFKPFKATNKYTEIKEDI
jgi:V/A-type H+-transporting ATPase subunit I